MSTARQWLTVLLDEVHFLMEEKGYKRFTLTGSTARKLKRGAANLLAGRAILRKLFPLTSQETGFSIPARRLLRYGAMPLSGTRRTTRPRGVLESVRDDLPERRDQGRQGGRALAASSIACNCKFSGSSALAFSRL